MTICPICNKKNLCNIEQSNNCWCFTTNIDKTLLALIPDTLKNKSCICLACITLFKEDPQVIRDLLKSN